MRQRRGCAFGVKPAKERFFVAGGRSGSGWGNWIKICEMYNISTNEWQSIGSLNVVRMNGSMVCLKGTLYVVGGRIDYNRSELNVECYDPIEDEWIKKTTVPVKAISEENNDTFTGCALKLS